MDPNVENFTSPLWKFLLLFLAGASLTTATVMRTTDLLLDTHQLRVHEEPEGATWRLRNKHGREVLSGHVHAHGTLPSSRACAGDDVVCRTGAGKELKMSLADSCLHVSTEDDDPDAQLLDCFDLKDAHWFGGPQQKLQLWPLEKQRWDNLSYIPKSSDNMAVAERYFLSSRGVYLAVDAEVALFVDLNTRRNNSLCLIARNEHPYTRRSKVVLKYSVCGLAANDAREAHMDAVQNFLGKPQGLPNERTVRHPIWSTWAWYLTDISQEQVLDFAEEILAAGFNNSALEIDDRWESCYGSLQFDTAWDKFPDARKLTTALHERGFRVTLWVHPFVNKNCEPFFSEALANGDLIANEKGETVGGWWNGAAACVDFTKPAAAARWAIKLRTLQTEYLIDSFKFDAGEFGYFPKGALFNASVEQHPAAFTRSYLELCAQFGDYVEVRSAAHTQSLPPVFMRMTDKDSRWGSYNGLRTLVTTLLQLNMVGYPFVLPDMIGGNGYGELPTKELFLRWLQANVFMPALQFSFVPWDYDKETVSLSLRFVELHASYADRIMALAALAVENGSPINPPIWWVDPADVIAQACDDEFLLGDDLLVAPVLEAGATSRDVYLPRGVWLDGNTQEHHTGPGWLRDYPAPLDVLPYFTLIES